MTNSITAPGTQPVSALVWDVYCKVIDNYGDVGVCWRLARNLVQRGQHVRLFIDNADALAWMAD
ncbi:MAG: elongation factor P maturation arginine rhamnosyltransferase EarP, partial [Burkholderiaceae bacterium]